MALTLFMVSNSWMRLEENSLIQRVVVSQGADAADDWIAERVGAFDIVITADILLAARCLKAGAQCIGPTGKPYTDANIGTAVAMRDLQRHLRETGESRGLNAAFTARDRSRFLEQLENAVQLAKRANRSPISRAQRDKIIAKSRRATASMRHRQNRCCSIGQGSTLERLRACASSKAFSMGQHKARSFPCSFACRLP